MQKLIDSHISVLIEKNLSHLGLSGAGAKSLQISSHMQSLMDASQSFIKISHSSSLKL